MNLLTAALLALLWVSGAMTAAWLLLATAFCLNIVFRVGLLNMLFLGHDDVEQEIDRDIDTSAGRLLSALWPVCMWWLALPWYTWDWIRYRGEEEDTEEEED